MLVVCNGNLKDTYHAEPQGPAAFQDIPVYLAIDRSIWSGKNSVNGRKVPR